MVSRLVVPLVVALVFLAGCSDGSHGDKTGADGPRVSKPAEDDGPQTQSVQLLHEPIESTGAGATQTWTVQVPDNVTKVGVTFQYDSRFLHMGLHMALDGCGAIDYTGPGGYFGINTPGTWYYPVCDAATPGEHAFTITLDPGSVSDAVADLHGDRLVA